MRCGTQLKRPKKLALGKNNQPLDFTRNRSFYYSKSDREFSAQLTACRLSRLRGSGRFGKLQCCKPSKRPLRPLSPVASHTRTRVVFMIKLTEYRHDEITESIAVQIAGLAARSFTSSNRPLEQRVAELMGSRDRQDDIAKSERRFIAWQGESVVAHAFTFLRTIQFEEVENVTDRSLEVLALATVCSDPDLRGQGLGVLVTNAAFEQVGQGTWPTVSLFQTPVPVFYEKLGCRIVPNRFVNRLSEKDVEANPWRDDTIMIYPATHTWHDGVVDLNGEDY